MTQVAKGKQRLRRASIASDNDMLWWLLLILVLTGKGAVSSQLKHVRLSIPGIVLTNGF